MKIYSARDAEVYAAGFLVGRETAYKDLSSTFKDAGKTRFTGNSVSELIEKSIRFRELIEKAKPHGAE